MKLIEERLLRKKKNNKTIYFIGTNQKGWLEFYIKKVIYPVIDQYDVHILTGKVNHQIPDFCDSIKIRNLQLYGSNRWNKLYNWIKDAICYQKKYGCPDICHVQFVRWKDIWFHYLFWRKAKTRILTFWGSDLLRVPIAELKKLKWFLHQATTITVSIDEEKRYFESIFGNKYEKKLIVLDFGSPILDEIDLLLESQSRIECKKQFGIDINKFIIHIGYSGIKEQQHMQIVEQMISLPKEIKSKLQFVFPFVYGEKEYNERLVNFMQGRELDYLILPKYYDAVNIAKLRLSCDLFIYGQTTDAMSVSPLEYLYAGAEFMCPKYLEDNYSFLRQHNIQFMLYHQFEDLPNMIAQWVKNRPINRNDQIEIIRDNITECLGWNVLAPKWRELY